MDQDNILAKQSQYGSIEPTSLTSNNSNNNNNTTSQSDSDKVSLVQEKKQNFA